jgi:hypothetical protein
MINKNNFCVLPSYAGILRGSFACFVFVRMAMIEAPLCFFQMKMECGIRVSFQLGQPDFCKSPKSLDPIDMNAPLENSSFE